MTFREAFQLGAAPRLRHAAEVRAIAFTPDGDTLVAGDDGGEVIFWDLASGAERRRMPNAGGRIGALAIAGDTLAVGAGARVMIAQLAGETWRAGAVHTRDIEHV